MQANGLVIFAQASIIFGKFQQVLIRFASFEQILFTFSKFKQKLTTFRMLITFLSLVSTSVHPIGNVFSSFLSKDVSTTSLMLSDSYFSSFLP